MTRTLALILLGVMVFATPTTAKKLSLEKEQELSKLENKVSSLESQVDALKNRREALAARIHGKRKAALGKSYLAIRLNNNLGGAFRLLETTYWLNKKQIYTTKESNITSRVIYKRRAVPPGTYTLRVMTRIKGHGYGIFTYMKKYKIGASNNTFFRVYKGQDVTIHVELMDQGGKKLKDRIQISFRNQTNKS